MNQFIISANNRARRSAIRREGLKSFSALEKTMNKPMKLTGIINSIVTAVPMATGCRQASSYSLAEMTPVSGITLVVDAEVVAEKYKRTEIGYAD